MTGFTYNSSFQLWANDFEFGCHKFLSKKHFSPKAVLGPKHTPAYRMSPCANSPPKHSLGSVLFPLPIIKHTSLVTLNSANGTKKTRSGLLLALFSLYTTMKSSQFYLLQVPLYLWSCHLPGQTCTQPVSWNVTVFSYDSPAPIFHGGAALCILPKKVNLIVSRLFFKITEDFSFFLALTEVQMLRKLHRRPFMKLFTPPSLPSPPLSPCARHSIIHGLGMCQNCHILMLSNMLLLISVLQP